MRYGYYLGSRDEKHGDPELAEAACARWHESGIAEPQRYDGCSIWIDGDGPHVRLLARDIFSEKFRVAQAMVTR